MYQGVATRNDATTREILVRRTGALLNLGFTEFSEIGGVFIRNSSAYASVVALYKHGGADELEKVCRTRVQLRAYLFRAPNSL
jgi:hypothetical protein